MIWFKKLVASWARQGSNYEEESCKVVQWDSNKKNGFIEDFDIDIHKK